MTIDQLIKKLQAFRDKAYFKGDTHVYMVLDPPGDESGIDPIEIDRVVLDGDHTREDTAGVVMIACKWWPFGEED